LDEFLLPAVDDGSLAATLREGLDSREKRLMRAAAESVAGRTLLDGATGLSLVLVAEAEDGQVMGALCATPPRRR
jgi:hypothetical protein